MQSVLYQKPKLKVLLMGAVNEQGIDVDQIGAHLYRKVQ